MGIQSEVLKIAQTYGIKIVSENPYTVLSHQNIINKWEAVSIFILAFSKNIFLAFLMNYFAPFPTTGEATGPNA